MCRHPGEGRTGSPSASLSDAITSVREAGWRLTGKTVKNLVGAFCPGMVLANHKACPFDSGAGYGITTIGIKLCS
jgi:hypothetical protein